MGLEKERAGEIDAGGEDDDAADGFGRGIDGLPDGGGAGRFAIAGGAVGPDVEGGGGEGREGAAARAEKRRRERLMRTTNHTLSVRWAPVEGRFSLH